jgi:hypothetical protein
MERQGFIFVMSKQKKITLFFKKKKKTTTSFTVAICYHPTLGLVGASEHNELKPRTDQGGFPGKITTMRFSH